MKRRNFLGSLPCSALGSMGVTNTLLNLRMISNATAAPPAGAGDYRALVCLFLTGGNDSFNMLVPTSEDEYENYASIRSNLALPLPGSGGANALLPLTANNVPGRSFGLNAAMPNLQARFNEGNAAFVSNVGTLVEPTTVAQYEARSTRLPRSLFSHNDQQRIWQTSVAQTTNFKTGWAGRLADRVSANNVSDAVSMNISLNGNRILLVGEESFAYTIDEDGATALTGSNSSRPLNIARVQAAQSLVEQTQRNILMRAFSEETSRAVGDSEKFATAFDSVNLGTSFGDNSLSRRLRSVARTIGARGDLGHQRQIFFVQMGGFDNHDELLNNQRDLLSTLDRAMKEFWDSLVEMGVQNDVTLFSCSDFGRTLRSNGLGTDHAWGGNSFVMGGAVNGSSIYGEYPDDAAMRIGNGLDVGTNGRLLPTTSVDEYFAELALWLGLPPGELNEVFPNLGNFYSYSANQPPIGFLCG